MIEKTLSKETIFKGRSVELTVHTVEGPNGITTREVVQHSSAVTIINSYLVINIVSSGWGCV